MASATKRAQGKWLGRYRGPDGKERTKTFPTKGEAQAWAQTQELRMRSHDWTDPARAKVTLDAFAPQWFDSLTVKPKTREGYESLYATHVKPRWGDVRLDRIAYADIRAWVANLQVSHRTDESRGANAKRRSAPPKPLSAARKKHVYRLLRSMLDLAVEDGRLPRNPAKSMSGSTKGIVPKAPTNRTHRYLSHEQLLAVAAKAGDARALVLVLGYAGLRWGEATALQVHDVDLLRSRLNVRRAVTDVRGELIYSTPKNHNTRTVPLPSFLREELEPLLEGKTTVDLLFTSPHGGPWRNSNFRSRRFDPAVKAAGLPTLRLHDLRHTAASLAVQAGANVKAVQRMLGHKSASMTLDVYADLFDSDLEGVAIRLDEAVSELRADSVRTGGQIASLPMEGRDESKAV